MKDTVTVMDNRFMEQVLNNALSATRADKVCLFFHNQMLDQLECIYGKNCLVNEAGDNSRCTIPLSKTSSCLSELLNNKIQRGHLTGKRIIPTSENGDSSENSQILIPLRDSSNFSGGLLVFESRQPKSLRDHHVEIARSVAQLCMLTLQKSRLLMDSHKMLSKLKLLSDVSNVLLSEFDNRPLPEKYDYVVEKALEILDVELCSLWLARNGKIRLSTSYSQKGKVSFKKEVLLLIKDEPKSGMTGSIAFNKEVFNEYGDSLHTYPSRNPENPVDFVDSRKIYSELAYPMLDGENNLIGLLIAYNKKGDDGKPLEDRGFSKEFDEPLMKILTTTIIISIKNVQLRRDLEKTQLELSHALETAAIEEALAGLSHDIKNVIAQIAGEVRWLHKCEREQKLNPNEVKSALNKIDTCVKTVENLAEDLKGRGNKLDPVLTPQKLEAILDKAIELISSKALRSQVTILNRCENIDVCLLVDSGRLVRAFFNLMANAIDAMATGGVLRIQTRQTKEFIEVNISDTGCGIPGDMLNKVLNPLVTTKDEGYGLGLALTKRIIEIDHKGKLILKSKWGRGTTASVRLPLAERSRNKSWHNSQRRRDASQRNPEKRKSTT